MQNVWKVIINPYSGGCNNSSVWERILLELKSADIIFEHEVSKYHRHIIEIVQNSIASGFRKFIIIGGDGSLNELVNGIYNQTNVAPGEITTAHISLGTGNDWQKTHKLPAESIIMIEKIKEGKTTLQDVGVVNYHEGNEIKTNYFINVAGMGFDAFVVMNTLQKRNTKHRSKFSYLYGLLRSVLGYTCQNARIDVDGKKVFQNKLFSISVGIGKFNGGGMMQLPDAIPDDGLLDVTIFRKMPILKIIANVKGLYDGSFKTIKEVSLFKGKEIIFESDYPTNIECDGELLGQSPARFSIISLGFRFIN